MEITPDNSSDNKIDSLTRKPTLSRTDAIIDAAFHRGPRRRSGYRLTGWLLASVMTDILVIILLSAVFLIGVSVIFKLINSAELNQFSNLFLGKKVLKQTAIYLFGYMSLMYFIFLRVFLGATVGEWSCGIRIGQPSQRMQPSYIFKVICRVLLITSTGVFILPLLSLIFKKDIAGILTKASLYTLR